jgi:hypothetical protein
MQKYATRGHDDISLDDRSQERQFARLTDLKLRGRCEIQRQPILRRGQKRPAHVFMITTRAEFWMLRPPPSTE